MDLQSVVSWFQHNWQSIVVLGWSIEKTLELIGTLTGSKIVDNLGIALGNILTRFGGKPPAA